MIGLSTILTKMLFHFFTLMIIIPFLMVQCQKNDLHNSDTNNTGRFKVIHLRNNQTHSEFQSLCAIDLFADYLPLTDDRYHQFHHHDSDLCKMMPKNKNVGYHSFHYSNNCSINEQVSNFVKSYIDHPATEENPTGILFSTPCNVNITAKFNFSQHIFDLVLQYNFTISIINANKIKNLSNFNELKRVSTYSSSLQAFVPMIVLFLISCLSIFIGSYWSGNVRYEIYKNSIKNYIPAGTSTENVSEIKNCEGCPSLQNSNSDNQTSSQEETFSNIQSLSSVLTMVIFMISVLLLLYFFYKYLVYVVFFFFIFTSTIAVYICTDAFLMFILPSKINVYSFKIPAFCCFKSEKSLRYLDLLLIAYSISLTTLWTIYRHKSYAWILHDFFGFVLCINMLQILRLPSLKICSYLLSILFIYDIFFVFITPLFTPKGRSIMVEVATGGSGSAGNYLEYRCESGTPMETLPMIFRAPRKLFGFDPNDFLDVCSLKLYSLLGYGDVMIPGLLIAYCAAFDRIKRIPYHLYFTVSMVSYAIGLVVTFLALMLMKGAAQPALLYLVPCTLLPLVIVAAIRKEFKSLWYGEGKSDWALKNKEIQDRSESS